MKMKIFMYFLRFHFKNTSYIIKFFHYLNFNLFNIDPFAIFSILLWTFDTNSLKIKSFLVCLLFQSFHKKIEKKNFSSDYKAKFFVFNFLSFFSKFFPLFNVIESASILHRKHFMTKANNLWRRCADIDFIFLFFYFHLISCICR